MVTTLVSPVISKVHTAFAAAAEITLDSNGLVPGLQVLPDHGTHDVELDLFARTGFQARVNPEWAADQAEDALRGIFTSVMLDELG